MRVLAIETATMLGGIAIMDDKDGLIMEVRVNMKAAHSGRLMPELDHALRSSGMELRDMDVFAVSIGPGSFTGLRIGLSTVKGLSYAAGKPVVGVPTLEAFAWNFPACTSHICPLLDARKKEVYGGVFLLEEDDMKRVVPETSIRIRDLTARLKGLGGKVVFAGEGAMIYKEEILEDMAGQAVFAPAHLMIPLPSSTAYLGLKKALRLQFSEPASLSPFYIRKAEAELKGI